MLECAHVPKLVLAIEFAFESAGEYLVTSGHEQWLAPESETRRQLAPSSWARDHPL